jgi:hypothetical protein
MTAHTAGSSNAQIARELEVSLITVQNYVSRILDKLHVTDRTQPALEARDGSLAEPSTPGARRALKRRRVQRSASTNEEVQ